MRKKLNTQFNTRQYMVSRDFEIYYYKDQHMKKVANHIHDYYDLHVIPDCLSACLQSLFQETSKFIIIKISI